MKTQSKEEKKQGRKEVREERKWDFSDRDNMNAKKTINNATWGISTQEIC